MSTIGVRELARHTSSIINDIEQNKEPTLVTRRGRPVVYMLPVDSEEFQDFVLAHAPQFVDGMAAADIELATGETVSLAEARAELETDEPPAFSSHQARQDVPRRAIQTCAARPTAHRPQEAQATART
jgi:antitoxin (DNA-binding transcriptional repressor) of toxin-antitoxin stability system